MHVCKQDLGFEFMYIQGARCIISDNIGVYAAGHSQMRLKDGCRLWNWVCAWDYATSTHCALLYVRTLCR